MKVILAPLSYLKKISIDRVERMTFSMDSSVQLSLSYSVERSMKFRFAGKIRAVIRTFWMPHVKCEQNVAELCALQKNEVVHVINEEEVFWLYKILLTRNSRSKNRPPRDQIRARSPNPERVKFYRRTL